MPSARMSAVFAEFERAMLRERVFAGLARARAQGKVIGRPKVRPAVEQRIRALRVQGMGMIKIGRMLGCGSATVQRVVKEDWRGEEG
jgi:DNA invertase Pin-like site-specific DNA recombinase